MKFLCGRETEKDSAKRDATNFRKEEEELAQKIAWVVDEAKDNVATILASDVKKGATVPVTVEGKRLEVKVNADIPFGHKIAIKPIASGKTVYKYGLSIGRATADIAIGDHVHIHNIEPLRGRGDLAAAGKEDN